MNRFVVGLVSTALVFGPLAAEADAQLMSVPLTDLPANQEVIVLEVALEPGQASGPHRHNAHVFVYVLEGDVEMQVTGGELMRLSPGEMFYERPSDVHSVSRNASATEPARFLVHIVKTVGAPITVPAGDAEAPRR